MPRFFSKDRGIFLLYRNVGAIKPLLVQEEISMKMFASKQNSISLLAPFKSGKRNAELTDPKVPIRDSFQGWLNAVAPTSTRTNQLRKLPRLTAHDVTRVNHATIREGESHRVWPPFAIERFLAAEVIRETNIPQYKITNANLRRISD